LEFQIRLTYSGEHNNAGLTTGCNAAGESVGVSPAAAKPSPSPVPKQAPSTSVLGATSSRTPTLPVTGPSVPVVPLLVARAVMVLAGAGLLWRVRLHW
jgi:hypothetical protein